MSTRRQTYAQRGAAAAAQANRIRQGASLLLTEDCRALGDGFAGVVAFGATEARRCRRMGLRPMPCPAGVLCDGVQVFERDDAPRNRK